MMSPTGAAARQDDDRDRRQLAEFEAALMEATRLVKFAKFDAATALLDRLAPTQPEDSRIHFARGLIAQRLGDVSSAIAHFMAAAAYQPVLDQASENVGVLLRASINPVRPALPAPIADNETFIYVIGSSYARSFGVGSRFLPLMAGVADKLTFLTPELAEASAAHLMAHLERCDRQNPVLLALANADAIGHDNNTVGTKELQARGDLGGDGEIIEAAARRQARFIATAKSRFPGLDLMVLSACPVLAPAQVGMVAITNQVLKESAAEAGIPFIDVYDALVDPDSGLIRAEYCSTEGDAHLAKHAIRIVEEAIRAHALLPQSDASFQWSHMMRFRISALDETRLWTEPHMGADNLRHSELTHFNYVLERAVSHLVAGLSLDGTSSVLVANAREGYVPMALPAELSARVTAVEADPSRCHMLRRLAHFTGRSDIEIVAAEPARPLSEQVLPHDLVFGVIHRDDSLARLEDLLDDWAALAMERLYLLSALDWNPEDLQRLMFSDIREIDLSAPFLGDFYQSAKLMVFSR